MWKRVFLRVAPEGSPGAYMRSYGGWRRRFYAAPEKTETIWTSTKFLCIASAGRIAVR